MGSVNKKKALTGDCFSSCMRRLFSWDLLIIKVQIKTFV